MYGSFEGICKGSMHPTHLCNPQDLFNLQPKKPNWDLKRDVEKKLERLDRRTQKAVLELIRKSRGAHTYKMIDHGCYSHPDDRSTFIK